MKKLSEFHEALLNNKFRPYSFYQIVCVCAESMNIDIPNKERKNRLYKKFVTARLENDAEKIKECIAELKMEISDDMHIVNKFNSRFKDVKIVDDIRGNYWNKFAIGVLNYEDV